MRIIAAIFGVISALVSGLLEMWKSDEEIKPPKWL